MIIFDIYNDFRAIQNIRKRGTQFFNIITVNDDDSVSYFLNDEAEYVLISSKIEFINLLAWNPWILYYKIAYLKSNFSIYWEGTINVRSLEKCIKLS